MELSWGHVALSVSDLERSVKWYGDCFGFSEVYREYAEGPRSTIAVLNKGELSLELFERSGSEKLPDARRDPDEDPRWQGIKHFCLRVSDLEELAGKLRAADVDFALGPVQFQGKALYYVRDPDGCLIELMEA